MSFYLLDNHNPNAAGGFHGHAASHDKTCVVLHTAETEPSGSSARNVAGYLSRTSRQASYHELFDSGENLRLLPLGYVAFGVRGFNTPAVHVSWATFHNRWGSHPSGWEDAALTIGAQRVASICRYYDMPLRRISARQARAGTKGICTHMELDPSRRRDPGSRFPSGEFMAIARGDEPGSGPGGSDREVITVGDRGGDVLDWQEDLLRWRSDALPEWGADGDFGEETAEWTRRFMDAVGLDPSDPNEPRVGPRTREAMSDWLDDHDKEYAMLIYAREGPDLTFAYAVHEAVRKGVVTSDLEEARAAVDAGGTVYAIGGGSAEDLPDAKGVSGADRQATLSEAVAEIVEG